MPKDVLAIKKAFGVTPQRYISGYRFKKALMLLQKGLTVGEVSEMTGFQDTKAFSRAFKKHTGISPSKCKSGQYLQP